MFRAAAYYDRIQSGLGDAFLDDIEIGFSKLRDFPLAWPRLSDTFRRTSLSRFPYAILYEVRADDVLVLAVGHLKRGPKFWMAAMRRQR